MVILQFVEVRQDQLASGADEELFVRKITSEFFICAIGPEFCCRSVHRMRWETADLKCIQHRYKETVKQRAEQSRTYRLHVAEK